MSKPRRCFTAPLVLWIVLSGAGACAAQDWPMLGRDRTLSRLATAHVIAAGGNDPGSNPGGGDGAQSGSAGGGGNPGGGGVAPA